MHTFARLVVDGSAEVHFIDAFCWHHVRAVFFFLIHYFFLQAAELPKSFCNLSKIKKIKALKLQGQF